MLSVALLTLLAATIFACGWIAGHEHAEIQELSRRAAERRQAMEAAWHALRAARREVHRDD